MRAYTTLLQKYYNFKNSLINVKYIIKLLQIYIKYSIINVCNAEMFFAINMADKEV